MTEFELFRDELIKGFSLIQLSLSETETKLFYQFFHIFKKWSERINLSTIKDQHDVIYKHFVDSLVVLPVLKGCSTIVDVGSGGGFPGIPIKIMKPHSAVYLLETREKKAVYLKHATRTMGLNKTYVVTSNIENLKQDELVEIFGEKKVDAVLFRALKPSLKMLHNLKPMLSDKGKILFYGAQEETASQLQEELGADFRLEAVKQEKILELKRTIYSIVFNLPSPSCL